MSTVWGKSPFTMTLKLGKRQILWLGPEIKKLETIFIVVVNHMGVCGLLVLQLPPLLVVVVFITVENCGLGPCVFERVGCYEVEVVFNCSDGECTVCNTPDPHRVRIVKTTNFWKQTDRVSPKTRPYTGLKPYKLDLQELQFNIIYISNVQRPHAGVTTQRVRTPGVHNQSYIKRM